MPTNLSTLAGGRVPDYIEFGWVTAPNAAGQSISAHTITRLTLDTEVADTGNLVRPPGLNLSGGSITANTFELPSGTYYFEATTSTRRVGSEPGSGLLSLYNNTNTRYVTRGRVFDNYAGQPYSATGTINGQFAISSAAQFELRLLTTLACTVDNGANSSALSTDSTADADQRTTIKLWKLR